MSSFISINLIDTQRVYPKVGWQKLQAEMSQSRFEVHSRIPRTAV